MFILLCNFLRIIRDYDVTGKQYFMITILGKYSETTIIPPS